MSKQWALRPIARSLLFFRAGGSRRSPRAQDWGWLDKVDSYPDVSTVQGSLWGGLPVAKRVMPGWPIPLEFGFHSWSNWVGEEWVEWTGGKATLGRSVEVTIWVLIPLCVRLQHGA